MILTRAYLKLGDVSEARFYLRQCEKHVRVEPYEDESTNAALYSMLAELYMVAGEYEQARVRYAEYMRKTEALFGTNHVATSDCYNIISAFYTHRGQYEEAIDFCRRALVIRAEQLGVNHRFTADSRYNLGLLLRLDGQLAEARREFALARQTRELLFGAQSLEAAEVELSLGFTEYELGNLGAAHELCERSYATRRSAVGKNHPDTSEALNLLNTVRTARARGDVYELASPDGIDIDEESDFDGLSEMHAPLGPPPDMDSSRRSRLGSSEHSFGQPSFADATVRFDRFLVQRTLDRMQQMYDAPSMSFQSRVMQTLNVHGSVTAQELHARFAPRFPHETEQLMENLEEQDLLMRHARVKQPSRNARGESREISRNPKNDLEAYPGAKRSIFRLHGRSSTSIEASIASKEDRKASLQAEYPFPVSPLASGHDAISIVRPESVSIGKTLPMGVTSGGESLPTRSETTRPVSPRLTWNEDVDKQALKQTSWTASLRKSQNDLETKHASELQDQGAARDTRSSAVPYIPRGRFDFTSTSRTSLRPEHVDSFSQLRKSSTFSSGNSEHRDNIIVAQEGQHQVRNDTGISSHRQSGTGSGMTKVSTNSLFDFFDNYVIRPNGSSPGNDGVSGKVAGGASGGTGKVEGGNVSASKNGSYYSQGYGDGYGYGGGNAGGFNLSYGDGEDDISSSGPVQTIPNNLTRGPKGEHNIGGSGGIDRVPGKSPSGEHQPLSTLHPGALVRSGLAAAGSQGSPGAQGSGVGGVSTLMNGGSLVSGNRRAKVVELSGEELWKAHDIEVFTSFGMIPMLLDKRETERKEAAAAKRREEEEAKKAQTSSKATNDSSSKPVASSKVLAPAAKLMKKKKPLGPKSDTKRVHWDVLEDTEGTIWDSGVDSDDIELADVFEDLKAEFSNKAAAKTLSSNGDNPASAKPKEVILLADPKRRQNMSIFAKTLMKGGRELYEVGAALREMDLSKFGPNALASLQEFLPQGDESEAVQGFVDSGGDRSLLGPAECFVDAIGSVPRLSQRIKTLSVISEFDELALDANRRTELVRTTSNRVRESTRFARLLSIILKVGNELNKGTEKGEAQGVRLASLVKLSQTKSNQNTTLLQYLVEHLEKKDPHVLEFADDFPDLLESSRCSMQTLSADVNKLSSSLAAVEHASKAAAKAGDDEEFTNVAEPFLRQAKPKADQISQDFKGMEEAYASLCSYVGENPKAMPPEDLFKQLLSFTTDFNSTVKKVRDRIARQEKRQLRH